MSRRLPSLSGAVVRGAALTIAIASIAVFGVAPGYAADYQLSMTPEPSHQSGQTGTIDTGAPIGPMETGIQGVSAPPPQLEGAPPLITSWDGNNFDSSIPLVGSVNVPPDPHGAAGPNHVVNVTNVLIEWYTKAGVQQNTVDLQSFFAPLTPLTTTFDPKVLYDQHEGRFVVITLEQTDDPAPPANPALDTSRILVAVSKTSNPNGGWWFHSINSKVNINISGIGILPFWADYPGLGVDQDAVYITMNMFVFPSTGFGGFGGVRLWILHKGVVGGLYAGAAATVTVHDPDVNGIGEFTMQPAHVFGTVPGAVNNYMVSGGWSTDFSVGPAGSEALSVTSITNPLGAVAFSQKFVTIANIEDATVGMPDAPQDATCTLAPGEAAIVNVDTGDRRTYNAVWRNGHLWTTNTALPTAGADAGQSTTYWYRMDTGQAACPVVNFGGVGANDLGGGTWTFHSQIAVDGCDNMAIGFAGSHSQIHPGAYYTGRRANDPFGFVQPTGTLMAGQDCYRRTFGGSRNRWGDYSGMSVDPTDDCTFWAYNEYAGPRGTGTGAAPNIELGRWHTRWGAFRLNNAPIAICQNINKVGTEQGGVCTATVSPTEVDGGSSDPDGDTLNFTLQPAGPYPAGITNVILIVDDGCKADTCQATIEVECPTPVKLTAFSVARSGGTAILEWEVTDVTNHAGFNVFRQEVGAERVQINDGLITGQGRYSFTDEAPSSAQADYWLAEIGRNGQAAWYGPVTLGAIGAIAPSVALSPGKPNPFSASTAIRFSIPEGGNVKLAVYNMAGRLVTTLHDGFATAGEHLIDWDGRTDVGGLASAGLYFVRLQTGADTHVQKLVYSR